MLGDDSEPHGSGVGVGKATLEAPMQGLVPNADSKSESPRSRLHGFFAQICSADDDHIKQGVVQIRLILGVDDPPLAEVAAIQGAVPRLLQLLEHPDEETRRSAAMCVTNLACGESDVIDVVLKHDGGIKCLQLLAAEQPESIRKQVAWALANLTAGFDRIARDLLLEQNAMGVVIDAITANPNNTFATLTHLTRTLANLCRHKPKPPLETVAAALPVCFDLMQHSDTTVQDLACWAVSYISDGPEERILACHDAGMLPIVLELLRTQRPSVMLPAIRTFGNFAEVSADAAQKISEMGVLQLMAPAMQPHVDLLLRKECCFLLSNMAADQVQIVLDSGLMPFVIRCMSDPELEVKKEAVWVVANIGAGTPEQLRAAVEHFDCIPGLCAALRTRDVKICSPALAACEAVLELGDSLCTRGVNPYAAHFEEHGVVDILSDLQNSPNDTVRNIASSIMMNRWSYFDN
jgi:hypothetical protein